MAKRKSTIIKEITALLEQVDMDGLLAIKQEATRLIYNQTVDKMNAVAIKKNKAAAKKNSKKTTAKQVVKNKKGDLISIEQIGGSSFNLQIANNKVFFSLDELKRILKLSQSGKDLKESGVLLYRWLKKERGDFISEVGVSGPSSPILPQLAKYMVDNFD